MKKIEIIIKPYLLNKLAKMLNSYQIDSFVVEEVKGYGKNLNYVDVYKKLKDLNISYLPKVKVIFSADDNKVEQVIERILETVSTGQVGDGKIFVSDIEKIINF